MERMAPDASELELHEIRAKFAERSRLIARKTKKSAAVLAINTVLAVMFAKGMPLHSFFHPVGQILLVTWALAFALVGMDIFAWIGARSLRKELDRIP
jgi:hypothetical protein